MRKTFFITLLLALISNLAGAQATSNQVYVTDGGIYMIPGALTKDGNAVLYSCQYDEDDDIARISILDENFQVVEQFTITHDFLEYINLITDELGTKEFGLDGPICGCIVLVKDIFGEGYTYMGWPSETNRIHIYSSDNKEISHIDLPKGYESRYYLRDEDIAFLSLSNNLYIVIGNLVKSGSNEDDESTYTAFYRIDTTNNGVSLVSVAPSAKIGPRAPRKGENVIVTVDSELVENDCMVQVVSASGQTVYDTKIPSGQSQLEISTAGFSKGVYVVTVSAAGVSKEAAKIIIR